MSTLATLRCGHHFMPPPRVATWVSADTSVNSQLISAALFVYQHTHTHTSISLVVIVWVDLAVADFSLYLLHSFQIFAQCALL